MAAINKTRMQNAPSLLAVSMAITMRQYYPLHRLMEEVCGFHKNH
jgi:hypothetical protein